MFAARALFASVLSLACSVAAVAGEDDLKLIEELGSQNREARQQAVETLGKSEIEPDTLTLIVDLAESDDIGISSAALDALAKIAAGDSKNAAAALENLKTLSQSKKGGVALRARQKVLQLKTAKPLPEDQRVPDMGGGESMTTSVNNGKRHITVERGDLSLTIDDFEGRDITVAITRNEKTTKFKGKDIDELRQQNAEAADLYKTYDERARFPGFPGFPAGIGRRAIAFGQAGVFRGPPMGAFPPGFAPPATAPAKEANEKLESCLKQLAEIQKNLSVKKEDLSDEKLKQLKDDLDDLKKQLFEAQNKLQ